MSTRITEALNCVNHALMVLPLPSDGPGKRAWSSLLEAQKLLDSLSTEPGEEGWQLIETAPKDGSRIQLLATKLGRMKLLPDILWIKVGSWRKHHEDEYEFAWREDAVAAPMNIGHARLAPTHWRMLPAAPLPEDTHHG